MPKYTYIFPSHISLINSLPSESLTINQSFLNVTLAALFLFPLATSSPTTITVHQGTTPHTSMYAAQLYYNSGSNTIKIFLGI